MKSIKEMMASIEEKAAKSDDMYSLIMNLLNDASKQTAEKSMVYFFTDTHYR